MCGIAGMYGFGDAARLRAMTDTIAHRGPDGEGHYQDGDIWLGNRRLAILDLPGGNQPMQNGDGSVVVVYNGEIYNYPELRAGLLARNVPLRTHCDTEILPYLYEAEGIGFAARLNGIFAFALLDRRTRRLYLVRDPLGVKPLLYARQGNRLAFGSEAKAILRSGLLPAGLDEASLHFSMNVRYVPGAATLFKGITKLPPGHVAEFDAAGLRLHRYASIDWTPDGARSEADWLEGIRHHYATAVRRQLLSDVPVGVSLSGGIDSSSIVAMVRRSHAGPLQSFCVGFGEPTDELADAAFIAREYGTDHHEVVLRESSLAHLREAIWHSEEPKVNSLQLFLLHRFVSGHVKVVLSGLGGDELFAGYDFYGYLQRASRYRQLLGPATFAAIAPALDGLARRGAELGRPRLDLYVRGLEWLAALHDRPRHYLLLRNAWDTNPALLARVYTPEFAGRLQGRVAEGYAGYFPGDRPIEFEALRAEFGEKMICDLLHNEDTMAMAHSVESRVPLLDLELVRYAARIPDELRFRYGPKGLLKKALAGILPERTLTKKKWGFTFDPVEQYHKDLRPLALEMLTPARLAESGIFNPEFVRSVLAARPHQNLRWHYFMLWQMIGFEFWREQFLRPLDATAQ